MCAKHMLYHRGMPQPSDATLLLSARRLLELGKGKKHKSRKVGARKSGVGRENKLRRKGLGLVLQFGLMNAAFKRVASTSLARSVLLTHYS